MWPTRYGGVFALCFAIVGGNNFLIDQLPADVLHFNAPKNLGNYLQWRLTLDDARLLSKQCYQQMFEYRKAISGNKLWALQMHDANAKIPSGLLRGHGGALGTFDQCLNVNAKNASLRTIRGKYCLGGIPLMNLSSTKIYGIAPLELYEPRLINVADATVYLPWGVCLPDACSAKDFRFLHLFILRFSEENCQTKGSQTRELDRGDIGAIAFLGVVAALMLLSTLYDAIIHYMGKVPGCVLLRSFSVYTNVQKIVTIREETNEISCLHGLRAISMLLLIFGFRFIMYALSPLTNWLGLFKWITNKNNSVILEAIIAADTFFVISGMLVAYNYMKATENERTFNVLVYYLNRIIRLTPALAATVLIHATLMRHIGSGPIWPTMRDTLLVNSCREHWWSSLLYVQNYVNPGLTTMCVIQTWQLSVDMQLFLLSPLILIPLRRAPRYTLATVGALLVCAIVSPFLAAWVYQIKAVIVTNRSLKDVKNYFEHFYLPLHTRAAAWLIGFILGYLVYEIKSNRIKIAMKKELLMATAGLLWALSGGLMAMCIFIGRELIGVEYNWLNHALYLAFMRPAWAIAVSWIILACATGYGGPINSLLSASAFHVISRISYCTYLINVSLMIILALQTRVGIEFSEFNGVYSYWGDIAFSLALGFVWTLAFESPMITIGKAVFGRSEKQKCDNLENDGNT